MKLNVITVFVIVGLAAVVGLVVGGALGHVAGQLAPDLWTHLLAWTVLENPVEVAMLVCAGGGAAFGAGLAVFAVIIHTVCQGLASRKRSADPEG